MRKKYMRKLSMLLLAAIFLISAASAQKISGVVKDQQGKGLEKTTISVLRAKDSSVVKYTATDNNGKFSIAVAPGEYLISATHVGYFPLYSKVFKLTADLPLDDLSMAKAEAALQGVTVSSK